MRINLLNIKSAFQLTLVVVLLIFTFKGISQSGKDPKYIIHKVEKGNTLYGISKKYDVTIEDILKANPGADKGVSVGQDLKIPVLVPTKTTEKPAAPKLQGKFLVHIAKPKETLYSLSKLYGVDEAELIKYNPELEDGLKVGMEVRIPTTAVAGAKPIDIAPAKEQNFITHTVLPQETIFSIAKLYSITVEDLYKLNEGLKEEGLKANSRIKILVTNTKTGIPDFTSQLNLDSGDNIKVAVMLPFFTTANDSMPTGSNGSKVIFSKSSIALQFYKGVLLAVDSLEKLNIKVELYVFDTENDTTVVKMLLRKPELLTVDMIIGPMYRHPFELVANWADKHNIPIVMPVPQANRVIEGKELAYKVDPSQTILMGKLTEFAMEKYAALSPILVHTGSSQDEYLFSLIKRKSKQLLAAKESKQDSLRQLEMWQVKIDKIKPLLRTDTTNVFILPSNNQAFVTSFLMQLYNMRHDYKFVVFGTDKWEKFESLIDLNVLETLHVHFPQGQFVDYQSAETKQILRSFRTNFSTDPGEFGFAGFDIMYYCANQLNVREKNAAGINQKYYKGLSYIFDLRQFDAESGYENTGTFILTYKNQQVSRVF